MWGCKGNCFQNVPDGAGWYGMLISWAWVVLPHDSVNAFLLSVQDKDARKCSLLTCISHNTKNMKHIACLPNICWLMNECITAWFLFLSLYSYMVYFPDFRSCAVIFIWMCFLLIASYCSDTARSSLSGLNLQQCIWGLNWLWKEVFLRRPKHPMTHSLYLMKTGYSEEIGHTLLFVLPHLRIFALFFPLPGILFP